MAKKSLDTAAKVAIGAAGVGAAAVGAVLVARKLRGDDVRPSSGPPQQEGVIMPDGGVVGARIATRLISTGRRPTNETPARVLVPAGVRVIDAYAFNKLAEAAYRGARAMGVGAAREVLYRADPDWPARVAELQQHFLMEYNDPIVYQVQDSERSVEANSLWVDLLRGLGSQFAGNLYRGPRGSTPRYCALHGCPDPMEMRFDTDLPYYNALAERHGYSEYGVARFFAGLSDARAVFTDEFYPPFGDVSTNPMVDAPALPTGSLASAIVRRVPLAATRLARVDHGWEWMLDPRLVVRYWFARTFAEEAARGLALHFYSERARNNAGARVSYDAVDYAKQDVLDSWAGSVGEALANEAQPERVRYGIRDNVVAVWQNNRGWARDFATRPDSWLLAAVEFATQTTVHAFALVATGGFSATVSIAMIAQSIADYAVDMAVEYASGAVANVLAREFDLGGEMRFAYAADGTFTFSTDAGGGALLAVPSGGGAPVLQLLS